jgi:hypothetical protein
LARWFDELTRKRWAPALLIFAVALVLREYVTLARLRLETAQQTLASLG